MVNRRAVVGLTLCVMLAACDTASNSSSGEKGNVSEYQAILSHLEETRKEIRELKAEVGELRKELSAVKTARAAAPAGARPVKIVEKLALESDDPIIGKDSAQIAIVEFSDYQCPFCKRFHDKAFAQLKETYIDSGQVKFISRDFPLGFHTKAKDAAIAASCAANQGAYMEMRERLFQHQRELGPELYTRLAQELTLDGNAFAACLQDPQIAKEVDDDMAYGQQIGVSGTPSFFIGKIEGGQIVQAKNLRGAQPYQAFARTIDGLLD